MGQSEKTITHTWAKMEPKLRPESSHEHKLGHTSVQTPGKSEPKGRSKKTSAHTHPKWEPENNTSGGSKVSERARIEAKSGITGVPANRGLSVPNEMSGNNNY